MNRDAFAERLAADGVVLLRNEGGVLPLPPDREVVLLGYTGYFPHRIGWGSGDLMVRRAVPLDEGLEAEGLRLNAAFADFYRSVRAGRLESASRLNRRWGRWTTRFPEPWTWRWRFRALSRGIPRDETCIVVIGRCSGESLDMKDTPGSFRLHPDERRLLSYACERFDKVVVVLNSCGVMDLSFLDEFPVAALVFAPPLGEVFGPALAAILTGRIAPSGKTVDTWARRYPDYPSTVGFGGEVVEYSEGSFVGYRHFDRAGVPPHFPFGFGLSYTSFAIRTLGFECAAPRRVLLSVEVANTGPRTGAQVVEAYASRDGRDESTEPAKVLVAFAKTSTLSPGESQTVSLDVDLANAAIWDEGRGGWLLPRGVWRVRIGDSSASLSDAAVFTLDEDVRIPVDDGRTDLDGEHPSPRARAVAAGLSDAELVAAVNGRPLSSATLGAGGVTGGRVDGEAGEFWCANGLPAVACADGPSGVRLARFGERDRDIAPLARSMFAWPCETAVAQGWSVEAAERFGRFLAEDLDRADVDGLLAPGVNIHRNPLCGRNFEYFSEDPLVAGLVGAAVVRGIQTRDDGSPSGHWAAVKHFCANNQEARRDTMDVRVSEKALREIYLRPFETVVKSSRPRVVMTAYNRLNGEPCASNPRLLNSILRGEWGFDGAVITDWWTVSDKSLHPAAGNDVAMPGLVDDIDAMMRGLAAGRIKRDDLRRAAARVVDLSFLRAETLAGRNGPRTFASVAEDLMAGRPLAEADFETLVSGAVDPANAAVREAITAKAREVRESVFGKDVFIRGLVEISSFCRNDCRYCGLRASNAAAERYRLSPEEIVSCADQGWRLGFRTIVLQGGEDAHFTDEVLVGVIRAIKQAHPGMAVTLSLGERGRESFARLREAGADRYLLRHETADAAHYASLHPKAMSLERRIGALLDLKGLGYQTGCGFMVGSPGQTPATLAKDLAFIAAFRPQMCGIGPFVPHHATPFAGEVAGSMELTCFLLSVIRLIHPRILLPATTALGTLDTEGREKGILAGANVVMPNLSPLAVRSKYAIYDNKASAGGESAEGLRLLEKRMESIGYRIVQSRGDAPVRVVAAVIWREGDGGWEVFATERGKGAMKGGWEFPGGKIEPGETPQEALRREIQEEMGAEIDVGELIETVEHDYPTFHLSMDSYWCRLRGGYELREHSAARWLKKSELRSVPWLPADLGLVGKIEGLLDGHGF